MLQKDLQAVYDWSANINMHFNSCKFEWIRYATNPSSAPPYQYSAPDASAIQQSDNLRDLGVRVSSDLSFSLHIEKIVATASQLVGWGLRTFRGRSTYLLLTLFKSLVQPHLDYCSQLWSPSCQESINKIEAVQHTLIAKIYDQRLHGLNYWQKLAALNLFSQERRRERYLIIFIWKISQDLVRGYEVQFSSMYSRTGRRVIIPPIMSGNTSRVRNARERSLRVKGAQLFNLMPIQLRNSDHGDILMFKNHLDLYLANLPDQPSRPGLTRAAQSNSLLHQVPLYEHSILSRPHESSQ